jgi:hypothetical protein
MQRYSELLFLLLLLPLSQSKHLLHPSLFHSLPPSLPPSLSPSLFLSLS